MLPADVMHEKRDQTINDNESPKEYTNKWRVGRRGTSRHLLIIPPTAPNANAQPNFPKVAPNGPWKLGKSGQ
jgi:hypothetical protein